MRPAELDDILSSTKGWKDGMGSTKSKRGGRRAWREKSYGGLDARPELTTTVSNEMARVSVDNTVLKDELFDLAREEHRASLLFKRAFLNWEGSSSNL